MKEQFAFMLKNKEKIIQKWLPVVESSAGGKYTKLIMFEICIFLEWASLKEAEASLYTQTRTVGPTGSQGLQGNIGSTGAQGVQGNTGALTEEALYSDLPHRLKLIYEKLDNIDMRIEIVGRFLNTATGMMEFKLSTGEYISEKQLSNYEVSDNTLLQIFEHDYLAEYRPDLIREDKINKILF